MKCPGQKDTTTPQPLPGAIQPEPFKFSPSRKGSFFTPKTVLTVLVLIAGTTRSFGQVLFELTGFSFAFLNATDVQATLETSQFGTFLTEFEIEEFFNEAKYSVTLSNGPTPFFHLDNANSTWDLQLVSAAGTSSAMLTSSSSGVVLDFTTPIEITGAVLILKANGQERGLLQYHQANNVSDFNFVNVDFDAVHSATAYVPYDSAFGFVPIPEPPGCLPFCIVFGMFTMTRKILHRDRSIGFDP